MKNLFIRIPDTNKIRLTKACLELYAQDFAQVGHIAGNIKTFPQFKAAMTAHLNHEMREEAAKTRGQNLVLDEIMDGLPGWE